KRGKWERKEITKMTQEEREALRRGPVQHEIPLFLVPSVSWSYQIVGHYISPTLEQWELGFMQDRSIVQEILLWQWVALSFIAYHRHHGLPLRSEGEERALVNCLANGLSPPAGDPDNGFFAELCKVEKREAERMRTLVLLEGGLPWSPPEG